MKEDNLDEREIQLRGTIYRNCFLLTLVLLLINTALLERGILWSEARYCNTTTILVSAIFVCCAQLWQGIYPISVLAQKGFCIFFSLFGLFAIGLFVYEVATGEAIVTGMALTDTGVTLIMGILFLLPMVFFMLARKRLAAAE